MKFFLMFSVINFILLAMFSMISIFIIRKRKLSDETYGVQNYNQEKMRLETLVNEISQLSTFLYGDITRKETLLKELLQEAHEKIETLKSLTRNTKVKEQSKKTNASVDRKEIINKYRTVIDKSEEEKRHDSSHHHAYQGITEARNDQRNSAREHIYQLADEGMSVLAIAKEIKRPRGEVELMLNLRNLPSER